MDVDDFPKILETTESNAKLQMVKVHKSILFAGTVAN